MAYSLCILILFAVRTFHPLRVSLLFGRMVLSVNYSKISTEPGIMYIYVLQFLCEVSTHSPTSFPDKASISWAYNNKRVPPKISQLLGKQMDVFYITWFLVNRLVEEKRKVRDKIVCLLSSQYRVFLFLSSHTLWHIMSDFLPSFSLTFSPSLLIFSPLLLSSFSSTLLAIAIICVGDLVLSVLICTVHTLEAIKQL